MRYSLCYSCESNVERHLYCLPLPLKVIRLDLIHKSKYS